MFTIATKGDNKLEWIDDKLFKDPASNKFGGSGAIGSVADYLKILNAICVDDGKLLLSETISEMFAL